MFEKVWGLDIDMNDHNTKYILLDDAFILCERQILMSEHCRNGLLRQLALNSMSSGLIVAMIIIFLLSTFVSLDYLTINIAIPQIIIYLIIITQLIILMHWKSIKDNVNWIAKGINKAKIILIIISLIALCVSYIFIFTNTQLMGRIIYLSQIISYLLIYITSRGYLASQLHLTIEIYTEFYIMNRDKIEYKDIVNNK